MRLGLCALVLPLLALPGVARADDWELIRDDGSLRVWQRKIEGTSLVEFRGRGPVAAPIQQVAAVIHNSDREKEWMESCNGSFTVEYKTALHAISYNRTQSPAFFISDRDVVLESDVTLLPATKSLRVDFHSTTHPKVPPVDGVVRMPVLRGFWELKYLGPKETEVTYQLRADPGGSLPKWLVNWASKSLPYDTIRRLREQVSAPGYDKDLNVLDVAIDWLALTETSTRTHARP